MKKKLHLVIQSGNFALLNSNHNWSHLKEISLFIKITFGIFIMCKKKDVQDKIDWVIGLVRALPIIPIKYFEHLAGTEKKKQKTPAKEIAKAERLKKEYYEERTRK